MKSRPRRFRSLPVYLSLFFGVLLGGIAVVAFQPSADAYVETDGLNAEQAFRLQKYLARTAASGSTSAATTAANRAVVTTSARASLTGFAPYAIRGGLAGVAAGVWIHDGIILKNALDCGATACPPPLYVDVELRQAEDTATEIGAGGSVVKAIYYGEVKATGMVTRVEVQRSASGTTTKMHWIGTVASTWTGSKTLGDVMCQTVTGTGAGCANFGLTAGMVSGGEIELSDGPRSFTVSGSSRFATLDWSNTSNPPAKPFGPVVKSGEPMTWRNPVFDMGSATVVTAAPSRAYEAPAYETKAFYNKIKDQTCTPEAPPDTTPEVCPDYFPAEWEEEFPNDPDAPDEQAPYADPDQDGDPNHSDTDDDGDGIPDTDDPRPFAPDVDLPQSDPDHDGQPNETDPDDDGDGIPDEVDPHPYTPDEPSSLPDDHPYADPDKDGQPNKDDTDDDGDGVPDTEDPAPYDPTNPKDAPNSDPDGDGVPNKNDDDDDGDGVPDTVDPAPYDPSKPADDPTFDGDDDGVPDKIDPEPSNPAEPARWTRTDTDGDGSPDPYDPSPDDPGDPAGGPDGNPDGDGVPNRHDPYPNNPNRPTGSPDDDLDQDGTPNRNDPDPYRRAQPTGGPGGDMDEDGTPNAQDPAPADESKPSTSRGGSCPVAPPQAKIEGPDGAMSAIFPFNMFIMAVENIKALGAPPKAPPVPILFPDAQAGVAEFSLSEFDSQAALARSIFSVAGTIYGGFFLYRLVSQSKEGD